MAAFSDWMTKKFLDWQAFQGKRKTIDDFAAYIGVSRPLLNQWMNGNIPRPGRENISRLAEIFGPELYDILEIPRPNIYLQRLSKVWENIPPQRQQQIAEEGERYEVKHERSKKSPAKRKISTDK